MAGLIAAAVFAVILFAALSFLAPGSAAADSPHVSTGAITDGCAACHRTHTGQNERLFKNISESSLCFSCHDGTGSNYNIAGEYSDVNVPADDPATSSYYAHRLDEPPQHTSALVDEFGGVLNRHSACSDCHNPHAANGNLPEHTASGWTVPGALNSISGVSSGVTWKNPIGYEYELCLKCHSRYTVLLTSMTPTYNKTDKAAEIDPANLSYHPVAAPGKNSTTAMQASLDGGKVWQLSTDSTIRCTMCHGNYRLIGDPPAPNEPQAAAQLAPHTSKFRSLLAANYRDRDLKPTGEGYATGDFDLCYLCHSEAPFATTSDQPRADTNFRLHGWHLNNIGGVPSASLDINTPGAGQWNAICAECHFETHSTKLAPWAANQAYRRGVNFAPNVQPSAGELYPFWDFNTKTCTLTCHGVDHDNYDY
jgi:predicted CXXCH cytochrome family protein